MAGREEAKEETEILKVSVCLVVFSLPGANVPCGQHAASPTASALLLGGRIEVETQVCPISLFLFSGIYKVGSRREGMAFVQESEIPPRKGGRSHCGSVFLTGIQGIPSTFQD